MNRFFLLASCFLALLFSSCYLNAYSIVYVHIGPTLPKHLDTTISQARLFNKECSIYLIANKNAIKGASKRLKSRQVKFIACESLTLSPTHRKFQRNRSHDWGLDGFWVYTSERFFYLQEFVQQYNLCDVFHFENDIMLYADLNTLLPTFQKHYAGMIAATFENDHRCVPGVLYISEPAPLNALIEFIPKRIDFHDQTDMESLAHFKNAYYKVYMDYLPIVVPEYAYDYELQAMDQPSKNPECFSNHIDDFGSIFDAAAWGVYLGGMDSTFHNKANSKPGKIDPYCVFSPLYFSFEWKRDSEGRHIPFVGYNGKEIPINNLHITNKEKIPLFHSLAPH